MANYKSLEAYSVFTPPSDQVLFPSYIPTHLEKKLAVEVQSSPSKTHPDQVGSVQQIPVRSNWESKSVNPKYYQELRSHPIRPDDFHHYGSKQNESEQEEQDVQPEQPEQDDQPEQSEQPEQ